MTIDHKKCEDCNGAKPSNRCKKIGQEVFIQGNRMIGDTNYIFLQCPVCGSVWMEYEDSGGVGGHGRFFKKLTSGFY